MKFTTKFTALSIDRVQYQRVLLNYLRNLNERAGAAWINAAVNRTPIPTWSGASRATFTKLAQELGTSVPIGPIKSKRDRISLGLSSSAGSGVVEDRDRGRYVGFVYETDLRYLAYNEYNLATAGPPPQPFTNNVRFTPYNFQSRAQAAWQKVADTGELPNPYKYLKKRPI
jgi:hypothetical protein